MPLIETKKALKESDKGETLKIQIDNETSVKNVTHYLEDNNIRVEQSKQGETWELIANRGDEDIEDIKRSQPEAYCEPADGSSLSYAVMFAKNRLGEGSDELGEALVGAMLNSIKAQDTLPEKMIFMNSGIDLVTSGSNVLPLLKELEIKGVACITCGACLDYFDKIDDLEVGRISNMHEIMEVMLSVGKVINV